MQKDAYYFPHDSNARNDQRIMRLRMSLGLEAYGVYFCLVEMLREANGYKLPLDFEVYSYDLRVDKEVIENIVRNFDLFKVDSKYFWSESLLNRMKKLDEIRQKRAEAGRAGGQRTRTKANAKQKPSSKVKKSKEKESKEEKKKHGDYVFLTNEEHKKLEETIGRHGAKSFIESLDLYIGEAPSKRAKKYESHYRTVLNWWRREGKPISQKDKDERQNKEFKEKYGDMPLVSEEEAKENQQKVKDLTSGLLK